MANPPFLFRGEDRNSVFYHNVRIFIFGADVTPWVTSQITVSYADRNGMNRCGFSLSNAYQCFEMTRENIEDKKFRLSDPRAPDGKYSEKAKNTIFNLKKGTNILHKVKSFGGVKGQIRARGTINEKEIRDDAKTKDYTTSRYPFAVGSLIFHKYDPIRVFVQNPFTKDPNEWYCAFAGYVDTKPFSQSYLDGQSTININAQDIRILMQSMRTQTNPASHYGNQNILFFGGTPGAKTSSKETPDIGDAGIFNDLINPYSPVSHVLGGITFKQAISFLLFGIPRPDSKAGGRVGQVCQLGDTAPLTYNPSDDYKKRRQTLEQWNNLINFGDGEKFLTEAKMESLGSQTYHGGKGSPDTAKVRYLFPSAGAPNSTLVESSLADGGVEARVEFVSRLELLISMCKTIDYQMYVSGLGDIIFEFPMYDFMPSHFNATYNNLYTFYKHLTNDNIDDEGGSPISALEITSRGLTTETSQGNTGQSVDVVPGHDAANEPRRTIFSNVLASRIGVHVETYFVPGVTDQNRLAQLGLIEFNKRLANFSKADMNSTYRPFIGVNRPIFNVVKQRLAITESITNTWRLREEVTSDFSLSFPRKLEQNKDGTYSFRFITGGEAQPISYNTIFDKKTFVSGQGQNSNVPNDKKPSTQSETATLSNKG